MKALVAYESMYGNTQEIAEAICAGLAETMDADCLEIGQVPGDLSGIDLLVLGGPTHARGMTSPDSRASAADKAPSGIVSGGEGIREWLESLEPQADLPPCAVFDTRIETPSFLWGSAAKAAVKRLEGLGADLLVPPESFYVHGPRGPLEHALHDGEVERARVWGSRLSQVVARTGS